MLVYMSSIVPETDQRNRFNGNVVERVLLAFDKEYLEKR